MEAVAWKKEDCVEMREDSQSNFVETEFCERPVPECRTCWRTACLLRPGFLNIPDLSVLIIILLPNGASPVKGKCK